MHKNREYEEDREVVVKEDRPDVARKHFWLYLFYLVPDFTVLDRIEITHVESTTASPTPWK
jgi:hypothetical protein